MNLLKRLGIGLLAVFATFATMITFEFLSSLLHPELAAAAAADPASIDPAGIPTSALLLVLAGMICGALLGGWLVGRMARRNAFSIAAVVGTLLTIAHFVNLSQIPHPLWFAVMGTVAFLPPYLWMATRNHR